MGYSPGFHGFGPFPADSYGVTLRVSTASEWALAVRLYCGWTDRVLLVRLQVKVPLQAKRAAPETNSILHPTSFCFQDRSQGIVCRAERHAVQTPIFKLHCEIPYVNLWKTPYL